MLIGSTSISARLRAAPVALAAAIASICAEAAPAVTTVYPTGAFPLDVHNVQAAVDGGGTVVLKASNVSGTPTAFNFGPPHYLTGSGINIYSDVEIIGERVGASMTTIAGGFVPIVGLAPTKTRIANIDFESPGASTIVIVASTGSEITGNVIDGVVPALLSFGFTESDGIDLFYDGPAKARISGNLIRGLTGDFANGVQLDFDATDIDVSGNTIIFEQSSGYIQTFAIGAFRQQGTVTISRNSIYMGPGSSYAYPAPMLVGGDQTARYTITGNDIAINHPNADGIEIDGGEFSEPTHGANVSGNRILINSGTPSFGGAGISLYGSVDGTVVSANTVEGSSLFGLGAFQGFFTPGLQALGNKFTGNDILSHVALVADVYLDANTSQTLAAGRCASAIDLGVANRINCGGYNHAAPVSQSAASARQAKAMAMRDRHRELIDHVKRRPTN